MKGKGRGERRSEIPLQGYSSGGLAMGLGTASGTLLTRGFFFFFFFFNFGTDFILLFKNSKFLFSHPPPHQKSLSPNEQETSPNTPTPLPRPLPPLSSPKPPPKASSPISRAEKSRKEHKTHNKNKTKNDLFVQITRFFQPKTLFLNFLRGGLRSFFPTIVPLLNIG